MGKRIVRNAALACSAARGGPTKGIIHIFTLRHQGVTAMIGYMSKQIT